MSGNIRIPPESTGPRIATSKKYVLEYDTLVTPFSVGQVVTGATSTATGEVAGILLEGYTIGTGRLYLKEVSGTFVNDEFIQVSAITKATVDTTNEGFNEWSHQENIIVDHDDPTRHQRLDAYGSAQVTFKDGAPSVGSFGALITGEQQVIKDYRFAYGINVTDFYDETATGATITYESDKGVCLFTNPTTTGATACRTSHFYHPYVPGVGQRIEMTLQVGDEGKANVTRRWGYYDDNNGLFFELNGTTLRLCLRSNTTGSIVETYVDQVDWNVDTLDGTYDSKFILDESKANIYWFDMQWLGAGRVRAGVLLSDGSSQVVHVFENANVGNLPYMRTATLPIRVEQINTGTAASSSELNFACASVKHTSKVNISGDRFSYNTPSTTNVQTSDGDLPVIAFRPKTTLNSIPNHSIARLKSIVLGNVGANNNPLVYKMWVTDSSNLTGASFASLSTTSGLEVDTSSTAITTPGLAKQLVCFMIQEGTSIFEQVNQHASVHDAELYLDADETTQKSIVITADNIGTANTEAFVAFNWMELHH